MRVCRNPFLLVQTSGRVPFLHGSATQQREGKLPDIWIQGNGVLHSCTQPPDLAQRICPTAPCRSRLHQAYASSGAMPCRRTRVRQQHLACRRRARRLRTGAQVPAVGHGTPCVGLWAALGAALTACAALGSTTAARGTGQGPKVCNTPRPAGMGRWQGLETSGPRQACSRPGMVHNAGLRVGGWQEQGKDDDGATRQRRAAPGAAAAGRVSAPADVQGRPLAAAERTGRRRAPMGGSIAWAQQSQLLRWTSLSRTLGKAVADRVLRPRAPDGCARLPAALSPCLDQTDNLSPVCKAWDHRTGWHTLVCQVRGWVAGLCAHHMRVTCRSGRRPGSLPAGPTRLQDPGVAGWPGMIPRRLPPRPPLAAWACPGVRRTRCGRSTQLRA